MIIKTIINMFYALLTHSKISVYIGFPADSCKMNVIRHTSAFPWTLELYMPKMKWNNNGLHEAHTGDGTTGADSGEQVVLVIFSTLQIPAW